MFTNTILAIYIGLYGHQNDVNFDKKVLYRPNQVTNCGGLPRSWAPLQRAEFREAMATGEGRGHGGIFCY